MVIGFRRGRVGFAAAPAWLICALAMVAMAHACWAQSGTDGAIGGRVLTAAGNPVSGSLVVVRELDTGLVSRTLSGSHGEFLLVRLPVGAYAISVRNAGVVSTLSNPVEVQLGEVTEVEARLNTDAAAQPSLLTRSNGTAAELSAAGVAQLPVNGEWMSLELTVAGANPAAAEDDDAGDVSFRGVAVVQNSTQIDGASGDESFSGTRLGAGVAVDEDAGSDTVHDHASGVGPGSGSVSGGGQRAGSSYAFSQASVREFRVQGQIDAAGYGSALHGHGAGGAISTVSRSGGATLHGMAFYTARNSAWAATNPFAVASTYVDGVVTSVVVKPLDLRQQFGGRVGGPLMRKDSGLGGIDTAPRQRLFYFYSFDEQRRNFPAISAPGYPGFYTLTGMQKALLGNRGVKPAQINAALNYLDSLTGTIARTSDQTVNFGRLDWQHTGSSVAMEYNRARWSSPGGARSGPVVDRGVASIGSSYGQGDAGVLRWVQFLRRGLSNEARTQYGHELQYETAQTPLPQEPNVALGGIPPEVSIGPLGLVFGTPAALGKKAYPDERRLEVADVAAWVHGRHFVQLGGDLSALTDLTDSLSNENGTFNYDSGVTGGKAGGLVDWITDYTFNVHAYPNGGCPSIGAVKHDFCFRSYSQSFGQQSLSFATQEWAGFIQDDWRVAPRLTVHAGLRYEYEFLPLPQRPNAGVDAVFGTAGASSVFPEDRNNFGPRLGIQWAPFGARHGVIRLGYGVYFGKLPGATIRAALLDTALAASVTRVRILPATETLCPQMTTVGFGYPCSFLAAPAGLVAATTSAMVFDRRFRLPAVQQGSAAFEHAIGLGVIGSARYDLNIDRQLPNSVDINIAPSTGLKTFRLQGGPGAIGARDGETFVVPVYTSRVSPSFGPVTDVLSNANASYNGLTLEARRVGAAARSGYGGIGRGWAFHVAWTWSKAIDDGQNPGSVPRTNGQFDPFTVRYDKGLSALNFPHRVVGSAVWSPRFGGAGSDTLATAGRAIWKLADGWSLAGIFSEASGRGYSYDIFGGTRLPGGRESINGSGGSVVLPTVGRNTLRLPDKMNLDLRLSRSVRLSERMLLRGAVESFNVTNRVNYSGVTQRAFLIAAPVNGTTPLVFQDAAAVATEGLNVLPFGTYTAASTGQARERQVQMGLRLEF